MNNNLEKNNIEIEKKKSPDKLFQGVFVLFLVAGIVTAVLAFQFIYDFTIGFNLFDIPGNPLRPTASLDNENGEISQGDNPPEFVNDEVGESIDFENRVTLLIMGLDYRDWVEGDGASRTDTMILFTLDPVSNTAGILSIPRDLWVNVPGYGYGKINTAYQLGAGNNYPDGGGPGLAMKTIEEFLGISIDYYAQIDFETFVDFVDLIGGIKVNVSEEIELEVIGTQLDMVLVPGTTYVLDGGQTLAYVRNRSTSGGDFDRAQRQQEVILGIRNQLLRSDIQTLLLSDPAGIFNTLSSGIFTNLQLDEIIALGLIAQKIKVEDINRSAITVPDYVTLDVSPDGLQILKPITQKIRILRDELFLSSTAFAPSVLGDDLAVLMTNEAASIQILNGTTTAGLAGITEEYLVGIGFNVVELGNASSTNLTAIYDYSGNPYTVQYLVELLNIKKNRIFYVNDPANNIDVQVILGSDWTGP